MVSSLNGSDPSVLYHLSVPPKYSEKAPPPTPYDPAVGFLAEHRQTELLKSLSVSLFDCTENVSYILTMRITIGSSEVQTRVMGTLAPSQGV